MDSLKPLRSYFLFSLSFFLGDIGFYNYAINPRFK